MTIAERTFEISTMDGWLASLDASGRSEISVPRLDSPESQALGQPQLVSAEGLRLLFDGRLHNPEEIRHLLGIERLQSDGQLLLRAFEVWGKRLLSHLEGEFALVIVDERRGELFAARDRVGRYPLFYLQGGGRVAVSTTIEAFRSNRLTVDHVWVGRRLAGRTPQADSTPYHGLRRLPPGHSLQVHERGLTVEQYWHLPMPSSRKEWLQEGDLVRFDELLEQAALRSAAWGRPAIFLSGGIDSVSVATAAVDGSSRRGLPASVAFSLHYPGEEIEPELQKAVAARLGIEHHSLTLADALARKGLLASCLEISWTSALPLQNPWKPATRALACLARAHGCSTVLTGSGGDEWLTADASIISDYLRSGNLAGLGHYLASVKRSLEIPSIDLLRGVLRRSGVGPLLRRGSPLLRGPGSAIAGRTGQTPDWLTFLPEPKPDGKGGDRPGSLYSRVVAELPFHPLRAVELDEKFAEARHVGMYQSDVYWDADLVEFLCRVPPHLLNRGGRMKGLVREKLAQRFPGLGFEHQKKVLRRDLLGRTLLAEGAAAWASLEGATALAAMELVEPKRLELFVRTALSSGDLQSVDALWRIFSLESWARPRI